MVTNRNYREPKIYFLMLHRLILKVTKLQLPTTKRFGTVVKRFLGGHAMSNRVEYEICPDACVFT